MSRVLKAGHFELRQPVIINPAQIMAPEENAPAAASPLPIENEEASGQPDSADINKYEDLAKIKTEADAILHETEQMVKELLETARQEAEKIISTANEKADNIITEGKNRQQQIEDEAFQKGWQKGLAEGNEEALKNHAGLLAEAREKLADAVKEREKIIRRAEDEIAQLAVAVARKIIFREMFADPSIVGDIVQEAIHKVTDREEITVRVHPADLDFVLGRQEEYTRNIKGIRKLKILADNAISPGGCVIETPNGTVDARIESQLTEIEQSLLEVSSNG